MQCNCITLWLVEKRSDQETSMAKIAEVLEIPATVTERGQTTVPAAIRKMLNLGKRGHVVFKGLADGTVVIAKKDDSGALEDGDPVIEKFLVFLAQDMANHPQRIRSFPANLLGRAKDLVQGVEVDLDAPLPDDDR
jgi:antitoxin PrlF